MTGTDQADGRPVEPTEEQVSELRRRWPGMIDRKTARKKLRYAAGHGCQLLGTCLLCVKKASCPVLDLGDDA